MLLAAKLDAITRSSMWARRKVVVHDEKAMKSFFRSSPSRVSTTTAAAAVASYNQPLPAEAVTKEGMQQEMEMKVMNAFRQIFLSTVVRMWRERKRRSKAVALNMMNGTISGSNLAGMSKPAGKYRKEINAQSSNVVGILSRRMIREVPALKFFDEEQGDGALSPNPQVNKSRATPRGVCYTVDVFGCRRIKMQSSTSGGNGRANDRLHKKKKKKKSEEITVEKAMGKSLRRKMVKRVANKRLTFLRMSDDFGKARAALTQKLRSQLALRQAESEKLFNKRLALLMADDTSLPAYQAQKELHLARVRCKKASTLEKCETLRIFGELLRHVERVGDDMGHEPSPNEIYFLDLFRCVVEENQVLTPIIFEGIQQHLRPQDHQHPVVKVSETGNDGDGLN
ncbi:TPA: hypothetical protein N0F65_009417 [Lagenidium giganteum]|uniref:Uncharacterized protein n=1 Tax=Lagenidium giganteum TaxID=4803 RepID=A0AAV2ZJ75_9STRA|nr:TPA: hypothetical protein N0F65_009417 [Lagenidium giganteum]